MVAVCEFSDAAEQLVEVERFGEVSRETFAMSTIDVG